MISFQFYEKLENGFKQRNKQNESLELEIICMGVISTLVHWPPISSRTLVRDGCKPQTNGQLQWQNQSGGSRLCQPQEPLQKETMSLNVHLIHLLQVSFQSK